ncbi:MAG TPA: cytochrome c [Acidimicrobiia bacterium]|nr:cytochrome c [Acidimicrobiia bacterium]
MSLRRIAAVLGALALLVAACSEESAETDYLDTPTTTEGEQLSAEDAIAAGAALFARTCSVCHGPEGLGVGGLGKNLVGTDFVQGQTVEELVAFLKVGRSADDPLNTTGIAMMARGGNPNLTDTDLEHIVIFLKSLG